MQSCLVFACTCALYTCPVVRTRVQSYYCARACERVPPSTRSYVLPCLLCLHAHVNAYTRMSERARATGIANTFERGAGNARTGSRAAGTPKMQAPDCAPRPARSAIGSPSASASGRGRVGRRRAPAAARGCTARPQTRAAMAPRGADSQPAQPPAQPSGALLHRRRPRAHAAPPRLGSPLCVDPWMARDFVPVIRRPRTRLG